VIALDMWRGTAQFEAATPSLLLKDSPMLHLEAPVLRLFCKLEVDLASPQTIGQTPFGLRRVIPIIGGRITGERLSGRVVPGGADWQTVGADGLAELSARYTLETDDGALIDLTNTGFRHGPADVMQRLAAGEAVSPASYHMRTTARLQSGHESYAWLNRMVFVGTGGRGSGHVRIDLYTLE
jgi:hypothetical protein